MTVAIGHDLDDSGEHVEGTDRLGAAYHPDCAPAELE